MSAVKLNTAGGGSVVVQPASSIASDVTVNVPSQNCTLGIQGPAFSAYLGASTQSVSAATYTKVQINTEEFDTASAYDNATNYRFTPQVAGYYQVNGCIYATATAMTYIQTAIYKNGSRYKNTLSSSQSGSNGSSMVSAVVYLNGSTDYVELYGSCNGSSGTAFGGSVVELTWFNATMVRSA